MRRRERSLSLTTMRRQRSNRDMSKTTGNRKYNQEVMDRKLYNTKREELHQGHTLTNEKTGNKITELVGTTEEERRRGGTNHEAAFDEGHVIGQNT